MGFRGFSGTGRGIATLTNPALYWRIPMTKRLYLGFLVLTVWPACAQPTPEQQFLDDAAAALGGRNRIQAVKTLTIEGEGTNYNLGQDMKPDAATQQFAVTGYKRQIDVANSRQRVEQTRTPKFAYFQGPQPQKQILGLDDRSPTTSTPAGAATRLGTRRSSIGAPTAITIRWRSCARRWIRKPRSATSGRLAPCARPTSPSRAADACTMSIDAAGVPLSISSSRTTHPNLGDVVITTHVWRVSGCRRPQAAGAVHRQGRRLHDREIHATKQTATPTSVTSPAPPRRSAPAAGAARAQRHGRANRQRRVVPRRAVASQRARRVQRSPDADRRAAKRGAHARGHRQGARSWCRASRCSSW